MELSSIIQGSKCPRSKGNVSDDICIKCPYFEGYIGKSDGQDLSLEFTKDKNFAENVDGHYFYLCNN